MATKFAGVAYEQQDIPVESVVESESQPTTRNDMSDSKRQALLRSMEHNGQKDGIDVVRLKNGRFQVIEGHGRVMAAHALGWKTIKAKVYDVDPANTAEQARIRQAIFEANDTVMKMSGAQWAQYIFLEGRNGQDIKAMSKAVDLVDFIQANLPDEAEDYILVKNVGPDALASARRAVREILGLPARGAMPADTAAYVTKAFKWVVKHGMTRPIVDHFKENKGHAEVRKRIENDEPLPGYGRGKARRASNGGSSDE
jgi:hypothetical protein